MPLEDIIANAVNWLIAPFVAFVGFMHLKISKLEVNMERMLTQIDERQRFYIQERKEQQQERDRLRQEHLGVNRELRDAINKLNDRLDAVLHEKGGLK